MKYGPFKFEFERWTIGICDWKNPQYMIGLKLEKME